MTPCRVCLFGPPALRTEEGEVRTFGTRRAALLLATLALNPGRRFSRAELAERLWPEDEFEATAIRLRQELSRIRKLMEPHEQAIMSESGAIWLDPAVVDSDVAELGRRLQAARRDPDGRLARLAEAIEGAVGTFMEGYSDLWALDERRRLTDLKVAALSELRKAAQGDEATRWSRMAAEEDPLSERTVLPYLRSLARAGQVAEALLEFDLFAQRLKSEVGMKPSPEALVAAEELRATETRTASFRRLPRTLPTELTILYGRERESETVAEILAKGARLTTLVGLGGVGKTRMAVALGARSESRFEGRVVFVPLADVRDGRAILSKVLAQIGTDAILGREDLSLLSACLPDEPTLLVLDNLEHLGDAAARFAEDVLGQKPNLQVLATSRQALGLVGERVIRLGPLRLPSEDEVDMGSVPSVALFVERARNAQHAFELDESNAATVAELVRRLGGLPLAIHLAASRVRVLTSTQMLEQIDRHEDILVGRGTEFATDRHRSMRAAMDWSLSLLGPEERRMFAALSVFRGGWTGESAAAVCGEPRALERIEELLDRSLIEPDPSDGTMRFRMLEPLREIAAKEREPGLRQRHVAYFAEMAEATFDRTFLNDRRGLLHWFDAELGNLRAALAYGRDHDLRSAHRLFGHLWRYFCIRGYYEEGRRWAESLAWRVDPEDDSPYPSHTYSGYAVLSRDQGEHIPALRYFATAAEGYARIGRRQGVAFCLANASRSHCSLGDCAAGVEGARAALAIYEEMDIDYGIPFSLTCLATGLRGLGKLDEAFECTSRALKLNLVSGEQWGIGDANYQHARTLAAMDRPEEALNHLDAALTTFREIEEVDNLSRVQLKRGQILLWLNRLDEAQAALDESMRHSALIGNPSRRLIVAGLQARQKAESGDPGGARKVAREAFACFATQPNPPAMADFLENAAFAWEGAVGDRMRDLARRASKEGLATEREISAAVEAMMAGVTTA